MYEPNPLLQSCAFAVAPLLGCERVLTTGADALIQYVARALLINGSTLSQETLRQRLKLLSAEKSELQSQLLDCHHRIEQEGKVCEGLCVKVTMS